MYSPKISEDLVKILYQFGKAKHLPITKLVDTILRTALSGVKVESRIINKAVPTKVEVFTIAESTKEVS